MSKFTKVSVRWISQFLFLLLFAFRFAAYAESLPDWNRTNPFAEKYNTESSSSLSEKSPVAAHLQHPDLWTETFAGDENSESEEDESYHDQQPSFSGSPTFLYGDFTRNFHLQNSLLSYRSHIVAKAGTCPLFLLHRNIRL